MSIAQTWQLTGTRDTALSGQVHFSSADELGVVARTVVTRSDLSNPVNVLLSTSFDGRSLVPFFRLVQFPGTRIAYLPGGPQVLEATAGTTAADGSGSAWRDAERQFGSVLGTLETLDKLRSGFAVSIWPVAGTTGALAATYIAQTLAGGNPTPAQPLGLPAGYQIGLPPSVDGCVDAQYDLQAAQWAGMAAGTQLTVWRNDLAALSTGRRGFRISATAGKWGGQAVAAVATFLGQRVKGSYAPFVSCQLLIPARHTLLLDAAGAWDYEANAPAQVLQGQPLRVINGDFTVLCLNVHWLGVPSDGGIEFEALCRGGSA